MQPADPLERIASVSKQERERIPKLFVRDPSIGLDHRVACFDLVRAVDHAIWHANCTKAAEHVIHGTAMFRGFSPALAMFMDSDCELPGVPDAPSNERSACWADAILLRLCLLAEAERVAGLSAAGLLRCVRNDPSRITFEVASETGWLEQQDVASGQWLSDMAISQDEEEYKALRDKWPAVQTLLRKHVRRFAKHYMEYGAHPELDNYYERLAILHARRSVGHDAFEPFAMFGGLPFGAYAATAMTLVAFAYKHMHFATEAATLFPDLNPRNLITTWSPLEKKAEFVAGALDCEHADAVELLKSFVSTPEMAADLARVTDGPAPFFIPIGQGQCASSIAAAIVAPYDLMLRRLKAQFTNDWFSNLDAREQMFREQLRWLFPIRRVHFANKPAILRGDGRTLTDIDAAVLVKATGTLGLFQLKWQDQFGADLRERRSRMTNLVPSANRWVDTVAKWIGVNGADALVRACGFPQEAVGTVKNVRLFVLGRYHVGFSGGDMADERAAWSTWPELVRLIDRRGIVEDPVLALFSDMREAHSEARTVIAGRIDRIALPGFEIEVRGHVSAAVEW